MTAERTHRVEVAAIGSFVFARRTLALQAKIEAAAERLTDGPVMSPGLRSFSAAVATLQLLTLNAPEGWSLDDADPLDDDTMAEIFAVFGGLRAAEEEFRSAAKTQRTKLGAGALGNRRVLVPAPVLADAA